MTLHDLHCCQHVLHTALCIIVSHNNLLHVRVTRHSRFRDNKKSTKANSMAQ